MIQNINYQHRGIAQSSGRLYLPYLDDDMQTRVKMCGFTEVGDVSYAVRAGVNAIGVIAYEPSPRCVLLSNAAQIRAVVPPLVSLVLVTVDMEVEDHLQWVKMLKPDILQFHGNEPENHCLSFGLPYIKTIRMRDGIDLNAHVNQYPSADAFLLDTYVKGVVGGTGEKFDWAKATAIEHKPVFLAGGLDASNVKTAIQMARPYAVDISSNLEEKPGKKDFKKISEFMQKVYETMYTNV